LGRLARKFDIDDAREILLGIVDELKELKLFKPEPYRFFLKVDLDTALWSYRPPHYIIIGTKIFKDFTGKEDQKADFFSMFVLHEIAHSLYTDYRLFKVIKILEERDLPFELLNLFEDARIEHKLLHENKINIIKDFNWSKYIILDTPYDSLDLFYWCVQKAGDKKRFDAIYRLLNSDLKLDASTVWNYYQRTINAKDVFEVIDIVGDWVREMHDTTLNIGSNLFYGEIEILNAPNSIITHAKDAIEITAITIDDLKSQQVLTNNTVSLKNRYSIKSLSSQNLLKKKINKRVFDKNIIAKIIKHIEYLFVDDRRYIKTSLPSKRLNMRNLLLKNPNIYKKRKAMIYQKKKITLILDISGSMTGIIEEMLILVEVFNILAKKGLVEGYLILSVSFYTDEAAYQTFKFPLDKDVIKKITTYSAGEGLAEVMKHLYKLLKPSDAVLVFTDGFFTDDPLNKSFFYKNNIDLYGIYLEGISKDGHDLKQYFDKIIVDKSVEKLAFKIVDMLKN